MHSAGSPVTLATESRRVASHFVSPSFTQSVLVAFLCHWLFLCCQIAQVPTQYSRSSVLSLVIIRYFLLIPPFDGSSQTGLRPCHRPMKSSYTIHSVGASLMSPLIASSGNASAFTHRCSWVLVANGQSLQN